MAVDASEGITWSGFLYEARGGRSEVALMSYANLQCVNDTRANVSFKTCKYMLLKKKKKLKKYVYVKFTPITRIYISHQYVSPRLHRTELGSSRYMGWDTL